MKNVENNVAKFGNVTFGETGISYEVPYQDPNWDLMKRPNLDRILSVVQCLIKGRLTACINNLEKNIVDNIGSTKDGRVYFKNGTHFSRVAAEAMESALNKNKFGQFDAAMFDQAIKACVNPKVVNGDGQLINASFGETELSLAINVLCEFRAAYEDALARAAKSNLEAEFRECMRNGYTFKEALQEWDIA